MRNLVSVIMPAYNASSFIEEAIQSVIKQSHFHLELLIINDGSTDATEKIIKSYLDSRIHYFYQNNQGVSAARNVGLSHMKGDYFCFLDADDVLPTYSIEKRLSKFLTNSNLSFVDGIVSIRDRKMQIELDSYSPSAEGDVFSDLVRLSDKLLFWSIMDDKS